MIQQFLFMEGAEAAMMGTSSHKDPTFHLYESDNLKSVGLCEKVQHRSYPRFLPRPYDINSAQATAVRLALIQYYDMKGWKNDMDAIALVKTEISRRACPNKKPAGGFVLGDGTGVGKTRELAAFAVSVILYEKAMQDTQRHFGPTIFGQDSSAVINAVRDGGWRKSPFLIWMTSSKPLFNCCQEGMREVVTNSMVNEGGSWKPTPDKPSTFNGGGKSGSMTLTSTNVVTGNTEELSIRFYTLQDVKDYVNINKGSRVVDYLTAAPSVLFMTYADLNANLEFVLKFITGGTNIDSNVVVPIDNFVTSILCDEFHQPRNISEAFRGELEVMWAEEDQQVLGNTPRPPNPSLSELVGRIKNAMCENKKFSAKRVKRERKGLGGGKSRTMPTSVFLSLLRQSDSFRLLLEVLKYDTFSVLASATPFQSTADLHSVDHILRKSIPAYTSIAAFGGSGNMSTPDAIAEDSEYATVFLEQAVKLLRNRGQLVSRCISIANVECSVVNCNTTPLQRYALDELASYCLNAKLVLLDCKDIGVAIADALNAAADQEGGGNVVPSDRAREIVVQFNSLNTAADTSISLRKRKREELEDDEEGKQESNILRSLLCKMDKRFTAVMVEDSDVAHDGHTSVETVLKEAFQAELDKTGISHSDGDEGDDYFSSSSGAAQELLDIMHQEEAQAAAVAATSASSRSPDFEISSNTRTESAAKIMFRETWFEKLRRQYFINTASTSVGACKSALLAVKAHSVTEAVKCLRLSPEPKKAVMSLEQTGDSFLTNLAARISEAPTIMNKKPDSKSVHNIVDLSIYDSSPLANTIFAGYRLLCRAVAMASTIKFKTGPRGSKTAYIMLVPAPPPVEPLVALSGNSLDIIVQCVGEAKHAEITNRKLCSRVTPQGMMVLRPNQKTTNTNRCIHSFNNTHEVDVMVLGPKGSTGLSLHDSHFNAVAAKRVHCLLDVPYNAIAFLQTIGRTHRNGQVSVPHFLIFSTDSPAECRFFDSLENRIRDSKAGTFADRYNSNSISITNAVNREQFLDKGLVLKAMGYVIRIIVSDITQLDLIEAYSKMMITTNMGVYAFVEGLNTDNRLLVEVLLLAFHITLVAIGQHQCIRCPERLTRAIDFTALLREQKLYSVVSAAAKFAFSNLCLNLIYHSSDKDSKGERLTALSEAAAALIASVSAYTKPDDRKPRCLPSGALVLPARGRELSLDIFCDLVSEKNPLPHDIFLATDEQMTHRPSQKDLVLQVAAAQKPQSLQGAIDASKTVVTVRVLGIGKREGVITLDECFGVPTGDMLDLIPLVAASTVVDALSQENPGLVFQIHNAALPHRQFREPFCNTSYSLTLARKLSKGLLSFRQFQNNLFSPKNESQLMYETFSNVKSVMARDDRLDGLCETRMNSVMGASYITVRRKPECVFIARLLNPVLRRHVASEDRDDECGEGNDDPREGHHRLAQTTNISACTGPGKGHDLDVVLCNGTTVTLTKGNSAFVREHIDSFVAGNLIGTDGSILQLCFDNCEGEFSCMPKFCLYDPSPNTAQNHSTEA